MMKKAGLLLLSAIAGSSLTIGSMMLMGFNFKANDNTVKIEHVAQPLAKGALYSVGQEGEIQPLDFRATASDAMEAVVHIKSTQTFDNQMAYRGQAQPLPDPFKQYFGDDFFQQFFGPRQYQSPQHRGPQVRVGTGSGVIINSDGYIVTNNHVIANADDIEVTLHDNRSFKATVIGTDPSTDLALIQIKEKGLPTIPLVNSDEVEIGEWVLAVGNPFNLNSTVTAGIVSAKARNINILKDQGAIESFIQTDAAINPGNSGGALVDLNGGLVGINTAIASPTGAYAGYGFAVPSNIVNKVVEDLLKYGIVQRGYLGVMIKGVDGNLKKDKDLEVDAGVYVDSIMAQSAAGKAGIKVGDVILEVDDQQVTSAPQLQELIGRKRPGDKVKVLVDRFGKEKTLDITLHNRDGETAVVEKEAYDIANLLGAQFETLDRKTAKQLDIKGGVKVVKLNAGKLARATDMREGFIITKIDGKDIEKVDELVAILEGKKGGVMLEGVYEDYPGVYYYAFGM